MNPVLATGYSIYFKEENYKELSAFVDKVNYSSVFILVDTNTFEHCYPRFMQFFSAKSGVEVIQIDAGEEHKNIDTCIGVWEAIADLGGDRKSLLITLGGGVVNDLGGFVAATFKRGIDFISIPTTLLAMVDASVGGKTGVDLGVLKNQVGLFANPKMVLIDPEYLQTLSHREIRSGVAEIIKYGLTYDRDLYDKISTNKQLNIVSLIQRSVEIKNQVVTKDPKEKGLRKILNFGHTIGHAVESYFLKSKNKKKLTHGEAIAVGMICECYISSQLLGFPFSKTKEIKQTITSIYGKTEITESDFDKIISLLKHDKKNVGGRVNFVLLKNIEDCKIDCKVSNQLVKESFIFLKK